MKNMITGHPGCLVLFPSIGIDSNAFRPGSTRFVSQVPTAPL